MNVPKYKLSSAMASLSDNYKYRFNVNNLNSLEDIESDLESALKAVKALIDAERKVRNEMSDAGRVERAIYDIMGLK